MSAAKLCRRCGFQTEEPAYEMRYLAPVPLCQCPRFDVPVRRPEPDIRAARRCVDCGELLQEPRVWWTDMPPKLCDCNLRPGRTPAKPYKGILSDAAAVRVALAHSRPAIAPEHLFFTEQPILTCMVTGKACANNCTRSCTQLSPKDAAIVDSITNGGPPPAEPPALRTNTPTTRTDTPDRLYVFLCNGCGCFGPTAHKHWTACTCALPELQDSHYAWVCLRCNTSHAPEDTECSRCSKVEGQNSADVNGVCESCWPEPCAASPGWKTGYARITGI